MVERKAFVSNPKHQYRVSNMGNMIVVPITKRVETIMSIQACLFSWINFDLKENAGKKTFSHKLKHQHHVSQWGKHDCSTHNKKNRDYYEYPSLSQFRMNFDCNKKKGFSCKTKPSISCIQMRGTWLLCPHQK